jgi:alpha/beta superfamily hydrolase
LAALTTILALLALRAPLYVIMILVPLISSLAYGGFSFTASIAMSALNSSATWGLVICVAVISVLVSL